MQLSARILTALAVLAFTVAVVAGSGVTNEVSAATGTIDALNVGACTTTNSDVLDISDCKGFDPDTGAETTGGDGNTNAFFEQDSLSAAVEVDELYATYAHDAKTAAEAPRGIIVNADLIKISIKDQDRDRRDPVLIAIETGATTLTSRETETGGTAVSPLPRIFSGTDVDGYNLVGDYAENVDTDDGGSLEVVADALSVETDELKEVDLEVPFIGDRARTDNETVYTASGTYTIVFDRDANTDEFKPIASQANRGLVKFFGIVQTNENNAETASPFRDLGGYVTLDEDVGSGDINTPPYMVIRVNVPADASVTVQVVYYETSDQENLVGGIAYCADGPEDDAGNAAKGVDTDGKCQDEAVARDGVDDVLYTNKEKSNNSALLVQASSDGNDTDANLYLTETGRFAGIYQGFLRLTDADADGRDATGSGDRIDWGESLGDDGGNADDASAADAAVLGVGDGPVTITYRDSNDRNQTFVIQIDIEPPTINIESPVNNSRSDDEKPSFVGTINDGDAGLAADSFQLYIDNNPATANPYTVLDIKADLVTGLDLPIERRLEYKGYADNGYEKYGVIKATRWMAPSTATPTSDYYSVEADNYANGAADGEFADEVEIDFDEDISNFRGFNHKIGFQALVRDLAGNVGFSDSDPEKPRFINDLGEKTPSVPNALGVFSRHVVWLDEVDPYIMNEMTATGFYGLDDDKEPVRNRSAVMVVFDNDVNGELIDAGTFALEYDDGSEIGIADFSVVDQLVFLLLDEELASDARPTLSITDGREVEDGAGNILGSEEHLLDPTDSDDKVGSFKVNDGILPVFTVTLSGGSGTGVGREGPSQLTNESIDVAIDSDETIRGAPKVSVVCSNVKFNEAKATDDATLVTDADNNLVSYGLSRFTGNRMGYDGSDAALEVEMKLMCGDGPYVKSPSQSLSRPGNNWVYAWRNRPENDVGNLNDGSLTVVVWGHDDSSFNHYTSTDEDRKEVENWGAETAAFTLDSEFLSPLTLGGKGGSVQPTGDDVSEPRPFVFLDFAGERTTVKVDSLKVDGEDVLSSLENAGVNRYLYWPATLEYGEHTIEFEARDAADNESSPPTKWSFTVTARDPFVLDLAAGWNAISFPADPADTALDAVFTQASIDRVVGWNPLSSTGPWSIASRVDGVWTTSADFAPLTDVIARYGYWVHSMEFVKQGVDLQGPIDRETGGRPMARDIPTVAGWNFVGVVDQDGDQTEDNWNEKLMDSDGDDVTADIYMPGFVRAYSWHAIAHGYMALAGGDPMRIGQGIWVYFGKDALAP